MNNRLLAAFFVGVLALTTSTLVRPALFDRGGGMIYDDVLNITWLQDANYALTSGYPSWNGKMQFDAANAWAAQLVYGGYADWRLPTVAPVHGSTFNRTFSYDGSTDYAYNISYPGRISPPDPAGAYPYSTQNELAYMFYVNLGNLAKFRTNDDPKRFKRHRLRHGQHELRGRRDWQNGVLQEFVQQPLLDGHRNQRRLCILPLGPRRIQRHGWKVELRVRLGGARWRRHFPTTQPSAYGEHRESGRRREDHARSELHPDRQRQRSRRHGHQGRLLRQRSADRNARHGAVHAVVDPERHGQLCAHCSRHRQQPRHGDVGCNRRDGGSGGRRHHRRAPAQPQWLRRRERYLSRQFPAHHRTRRCHHTVAAFGQLHPADPLCDLPIGGWSGSQRRGDPVGHARALQAVLQRHAAVERAAETVGRGRSDVDGEPDRRGLVGRRRGGRRNGLQHGGRRAGDAQLEPRLGHLRRDPACAAVGERRRELRLAHDADDRRHQQQAIQLERVQHRRHLAPQAHRSFIPAAHRTCRRR